MWRLPGVSETLDVDAARVSCVCGAPPPGRPAPLSLSPLPRSSSSPRRSRFRRARDALVFLTGVTLSFPPGACRYYSDLFPLNPGGIVPAGPTAADLGLTHPPPGGAFSDAEARALFRTRAEAAPAAAPAAAA